MIKIYYNSSNHSSQKAIKWFEAKGLEVSIKKIKQISKEDLVYILFLSNNGFEDIYKRNVRIYFKKHMEKMDKMDFNDTVDFILKHTELLKTPILIDKNKLMIGFNAEEIRKFIPKNHRKYREWI